MKITQDMLSMDQSYMILEEKLNTRFNYPASIDTSSGRPSGRKSHQQRDGCDQTVHEWYKKYTPLKVSREKIYQDCSNT